MRVTNNGREAVSFIVSGNAKNGVPPTDSVGPGETKDIDVSADDVQLQGAIAAGLVSVEGRAATKAVQAVAGENAPAKGK